MAKSNLYLFLCGLLVVLFSCTSKTDRGEPSDIQSFEEVTLQKVGAVGQDTEELFFAQPGMVSPVLTNKFVVADEQTKKLYYFDQDLQLIEAVGQEGKGPGDFLRINNIIAKDSILSVVDARNMRISTYVVENEGLHLEHNEEFEYVMLREHPAASFSKMIPFAEGYLSIYFDFNIRSKEEVKMTKIVGVPYTRSLMQDTSLASFALDFRPEMRIDRNILTIPYARRAFYDIITNGLVYAVNNQPEIQLINRFGEVESTISLPDSSMKLTSEDKVEAYNYAYRNSPDPDKYRDEVLENMPDKKPIIQNLKSDADNRIWVQYYPDDEQKNGPWFLFDRNGRGLFKLRLPEKTVFRNAKGQRVYVQGETEDGPEIAIYEW